MFLSKKNLLISMIVFVSLFFLVQSLVFGKTIKVMDKGLNMLRETIEIPGGWKLDADIASDSMTGLYVRFKHDIIGPEGEMLRELPPIYYGIVTGKTFQQTWQIITHEGMKDFMDIKSTGGLVENGPIAKRMLDELNLTFEQLAASQKKIFEVTVTGEKNNQPYTAVYVFSLQAFDGQSGMMAGGIIGSPAERFDDTLETSFKISKATSIDPQYDAKRSSLIDQATQMSTAQHNQRMRNNQQQFNQHQKMMGERSQMLDQQNQQWMNNFSKSSPNYGSDNYDSQDAYIDSIHETSTFEDAYSGQNKTLDGQYQYNYTDGMGGYYGTDDPSYNPNMMQNGDWQEIQPMQPQY